MSRTEERARAAMRAIAGTVHDAPPLRLEAAADEPRTPARAPRRAPGGGRPRRWRAWAAPLAAAAVVVALAIALVLVKDLPNGGAVPPNPATSATGPGGAPRYYVALREVADKTRPQAQFSSARYGIVVGDSVTGKTVATFAPPAHTTFQSVSAAADDRTFVVFAVTSASDFGLTRKADTLTGSWYEVQLAPGTASPARLSPLPVKPWSWTTGNASTPSAGQVYATALSGSGRELAVAGVPGVPAAGQPQDWQEVKVFSVATGRLLHDWTENAPAVRFTTVLSDTFAGVPIGTPALTWINGDQALAVATSRETAGTVTGTVRRLNVSGPASGSLQAASTVIWSGTLSGSALTGCYSVNGWPPQVSGDGKAIGCVTAVMPQATPGHIDFGAAPLTAGTPADVKPRSEYQAAIPPEKQTGGAGAGILWLSPSADTLIVEWQPGGDLSPHQAYFGVVSHGRFTPLRIPASLAASTALGITF